MTDKQNKQEQWVRQDWYKHEFKCQNRLKTAWCVLRYGKVVIKWQSSCNEKRKGVYLKGDKQDE